MENSEEKYIKKIFIIANIDFFTPASSSKQQRNSTTMDRLRCWKSLLTILIVISICQFQTSEANCTCLSRHPQTHFCDSDFAAYVRVNKLRQSDDNVVAYKVRVGRIFKAKKHARIALERKVVWLWSLSTHAMCARFDLIVGEKYVVSGRTMGPKLYISLCDLIQTWSNSTPRQRGGFEQFYEPGCACRISDKLRHHKGTFQSEGGKSCIWESSPGPRDAQELYGVCMPSSEGCSWARVRSLTRNEFNNFGCSTHVAQNNAEFF